MSDEREPDLEYLMGIDAIRAILEQPIGISDDGMVVIGAVSNGIGIDLVLNGTFDDGHESDEDFVARIKYELEDFHKKTRLLTRVDKTDWETYARGKVTMFKECEDSEYVHGYDTFGPVSILAERFLREGERIDQISEIKWLKPLTEDVKLAVYEVDMQRPSDIEDEDIFYQGRFRTDQGREFCFVAVQTGEKIKKYIDSNVSLGGAPVIDKYMNGGVYTKVYNPGYPESLASLGRHDTAYVSRSLMQMLTTNMMEVMSDAVYEEHHEGNGFRALFCGIEGLDLPVDMSEVFENGSKLEMRVPKDGRKKGKSGFEMWPVEYKFHFQDDWNRAAMAFKIE